MSVPALIAGASCAFIGGLCLALLNLRRNLGGRLRFAWHTPFTYLFVAGWAIASATAMSLAMGAIPPRDDALGLSQTIGVGIASALMPLSGRFMTVPMRGDDGRSERVELLGFIRQPVIAAADARASRRILAIATGLADIATSDLSTTLRHVVQHRFRGDRRTRAEYLKIIERAEAESNRYALLGVAVELYPAKVVMQDLASYCRDQRTRIVQG